MLTTIIVILTMVVVAIYDERVASQRLTDQILDELSVSIDAAEVNLATRFEFAEKDAIFLSQTPGARGITRALANEGVDPSTDFSQAEWERRLAATLSSLLESRPNYEQLRYLDITDGHELVRVMRDEAGTIATAAPEMLLAKADQLYFQRAAKLGRGEVYISDFDFRPGENGYPIFRAVTPVFDHGGTVRGLMVINVNSRFLTTLLGNELEAGKSFFVADQQGRYIVGPGRPSSGNGAKDDVGFLQSDFDELSAVVLGTSKIYKGPVETDEGATFAAVQRVYPYAGEPDRAIVMATLLDRQVLLGSHPAGRIEFMILALALVVGGGALAMLFARAIVRPLNSITLAADQIAKGEMQVDIAKATKRRDEIGVLATAFQTMSEKLEQREEEIALKNAELQRSNEELSQFAYVASHDLQEPLRMVGSYLGLIVRRYGDQLDEDGKEFIAYAVDGAERMKRLINDLLGYSRVSNRPLDIERVDTGALVNRLVANLQDSEAEFTIGDLPTVDCDPVQIERLLVNLLDNAIKYRSDAPLKVAIDAVRKDSMWEFTVTDNGIGIKEEFREKIFEIFTRLHSRDKYEGTGIGLASCRRIVERHHGTIGWRPAPGGGSTFHFTLPATGVFKELANV